jgi:hypothetical protein
MLIAVNRPCGYASLARDVEEGDSHIATGWHCGPGNNSRQT